MWAPFRNVIIKLFHCVGQIMHNKNYFDVIKGCCIPFSENMFLLITQLINSFRSSINLNGLGIFVTLFHKWNCIFCYIIVLCLGFTVIFFFHLNHLLKTLFRSVNNFIEIGTFTIFRYINICEWKNIDF